MKIFTKIALMVVSAGVLGGGNLFADDPALQNRLRVMRERNPQLHERTTTIAIHSEQWVDRKLMAQAEARERYERRDSGRGTHYHPVRVFR